MTYNVFGGTLNPTLLLLCNDLQFIDSVSVFVAPEELNRAVRDNHLGNLYDTLLPKW